MNDDDLRRAILIAAADAALDFAIYDRADDGYLSSADVQQAVQGGLVTVEEIIDAFGFQVREHL